MWWHLVLISLLAEGVHAAYHGLIQWKGFSARRFVLAPKSDPNMDAASPQQLTIQKASDVMFSTIPSRFTVGSDDTITLDTKGWCVEASGSQSGDTISVNHCTGRSTQRWNVLPLDGGARTQIQLKGTQQCLDIIESESDLDEAQLQLRECASTGSTLWEFEGYSLRSMSRPAALSFAIQQWMLSLSMIATIATLSLGGWRWRCHTQHSAASNQRSGSYTGGICLTMPFARQGNVQMTNSEDMVSAAMATRPMAGVASGTMRGDETISAASSSTPAVMVMDARVEGGGGGVILPGQPGSGGGGGAQAFGRGMSGTVAHEKTPLVYSETLSSHLGAEVYLKLDCLQPPGSFKIRGIGETVRRAVEAGAEHIVSSSGGNAGLAAAYAARRFGVPATVVLPTTTPESVHGRLRRFGADVIVYGGVWDEADQHARKVVEEKKGAYVHPFDQPSTWAGHATLVEELSQQLPQAPDAIVTCVGGGGLLMGILQGVEACGWSSSTRVIACETEGAASMAGSLAAGELVTVPITSVAKSLGAQRVSKEIFEYCKKLGPTRVQPFVMSDAAAVRACVRLAAEHRLLVEPACGAALAAVTERSDSLAGCATVVVEVCGGALVDLSTLSEWARQLGVAEVPA